MLSITALKSVTQALTYYQKDNYYTKEMADIEESTCWSGSGAQKLGLNGPVIFDDFKALLQGKLPDGTQLGWDEKATTEYNAANPDKKRSAHRPGYDLTFSAPKSASLLALCADDERIITAHQSAVDYALTYMEKNAAITRITANAKTAFIQTHNLVVARFLHDVSRDLDPQLHTHCVVMNMTHTDKGWRSLSSEQLFEHKMTAGSLYRSHFAFELKKLGYEITKTHADGRFEISGIPDAIIKNFSKRRQTIEQALSDAHQEGPKASADMTLRTRQSKTALDKAALHQRWQQEANNLGFNFSTVFEQSKTQENKHPIILAQHAMDVVHIADKAVVFAIKHLSEYCSTFGHDNLAALALREAIGQWVSPDAINQAIERAKEQKQLLIHGKDYTTPFLQQQETILLTRLHQAPSLTPIAHFNYFVERLIKKQDLPLTHATLARAVLKSDQQFIIADNFQALQDANTLKQIGRFAENRNYTVRIFSPTQKSAAWLSERTGLTGQTMAQLLTLSMDKINSFSKRQLWFVHKAEGLSTRDLNQLTERATLCKARVVFLQSDKNLLSIRAGNTPQLLKKTAAQSIMLRDNSLSQDAKHNTSQLINSVEKLLTYVHQKNQLINIEKPHDRQQAIVNHVLQYPETLVVTEQAKERHALNQAIREAKKAAGDIKGEERNVSVWVKRSFSAAEKSLLSSYQLGNQCLFSTANRKLGIKQQLPYVISNIEGSLLYLTPAKGKTITWDPNRHQGTENVTLYQQQHRAIALGDSILLSQNDEQGRWKKGDIATVTKLHGHKIKLKNHQGRTMTISLHKNNGQHWDYAYTMSPYQLTDNSRPLLMVIDNKNLNLASHRTLLTTYQYSKNLPWLVTDDSALLEKKLAGTAFSPALAIDKDFSYTPSSNASLKRNSDYFMMQLAQDSVHLALEILTEREAVFKQKDLTKLALSLSLGNTSPAYIEQATEEFEAQGELIRINKHQSTTLASLEQEQAVVNWVTEGQNKLPPLLEPQALQQSLKQLTNSQANDEQKQAIFHILTSPHQLMGIQGYAGTGKTRMLQWVKHYADTANITVTGIAPSAAAGQQLELKAGIKSYTLEKYLMNASKPLFKEAHKNTPSLLIIDESSMASTRQFAALKSAVSELPLHIIAIGDIRQLQAIEQGKPFSLLQSAGLHTVTLKNIQRQTSPLLRQIVYESLNPKTLHRAWQKLAPHMIEDPQRNIAGSMQSLVESYNKLSSKERADTLILTASNKDRKLLNGLIREVLNDKKELYGVEFTNSILVNRDLTATEMTLASNYTVGEILRFNGEHKRLGITAGSYWHITHSCPKTNQLTLQNSERGKCQWSPHTGKGQRGFVEVYQKEERKLQVGDAIRWRRNDERREIINAQTATISELNGQQATIQLKNDKTISMNLSSPINQHWDYGYVSTVHVAQGDDAPRVFVLLNSASKILHTERSFYVALSRAKSQITLYTDNKKEIAEAIFKQTGEKSSSLEALHYFPFSSSASLQRTTPPTLSPHNNPEKSSAEPNALITHSLISRPQNQEFLAKSPVPSSEQPSFLAQKYPEALHQLDAKFIQQALATEAETVATTLLGKPKRRSGTALLFGKNKGSLHVHISGEKQGFWYDFQTGDGGNLIQLIQQVQQCDFKEALGVGAKLARLSFSSNAAPQHAINTRQEANSKMPTSDFTPQQQRMRDYARKLFQEAKPIANTLGEKYLNKHRHLLGPYPPSIRFHPSLRHTETKTNYPAVLFAATDKNGQLQAVQAVFLDPTTGNKAALDVVKKTYGPIRGAAVELQKGKDGIVTLAEGPETALSIAKARVDLTVKASLGISNMQNAPLSLNCKHLLLCADNDGVSSPTQSQYQKIVQTFTSRGIAVHLLQAPGLKQDFNDMLKIQGIEKLKAFLEHALAKQLSLPSIASSLALSENTSRDTKKISLSETQSLTSPNQSTTRETPQSNWQTWLQSDNSPKQLPTPSLEELQR